MMVALLVVAAMALSFVAGALVMRNNYAWTKNVEAKAVNAAKALK